MSGIIVPIMRRTQFNHSYLGNNATETVEIQRALNVSWFTRATLSIRIHGRTMSAGQSIRCALYNTLPSPEDPREFFSVDSGGAPFLYIDVTSSSPSSLPGLLSDTATSPDAFLKFQIEITQGSTGGTALYADLSAVLTLREF